MRVDEYNLKRKSKIGSTDRVSSIGAKERRVKTVKLLLEDEPRVILDAGCGNGLLSRKFKKRGNIVVGAEINVGEAKNASKFLDLVVLCNLERKWPFKDETFDAVHMGAFLEHIFDYHHALNEANRVLKLGGVLVVSVPNGVCLRDRILMLLGKQPKWYELMEHIHFWTIPWLRKILAMHGFEEIVIEGTSFPLKEFLYKYKIFNRIFGYLEKRLPGFCITLIYKGIKTKNVVVFDEHLPEDITYVEATE